MKEYDYLIIGGGLIAPDAQRMLGKFGLSLPKDILVSPQMFYVDSRDLQTGNRGKYQRHYLNTDRRKFDNWLLSLIPDSVDLYRPARYRGHEEKDDHLIVDVELPSGRKRLKTKYLIGSDGGQSQVRRGTAGDFTNITRYVSLQSTITGQRIPDCYEVFFDRSLTDFYGWKIPKDRGFLIGVALKRGNVKETYERFLTKVLGDEFEERDRKACTIIRPGKRTDFRTHYGKRIFFIGEAAGFISPSSAEGFSYAFKSAHLLSKALARKGNTARYYHRKSMKIRAQLTLKSKKSFFMYNQTIRNLILKWASAVYNREGSSLIRQIPPITQQYRGITPFHIFSGRILTA